MPELSESNALIQKIAEKMAREKVASRAKAIDAKCEFPWDVVDACREHGFLYLMLPEEYGGLSASVTSLCVVIEELARASGTTSLIVLAHNVGLMPIVIAATDAQKKYVYDKVTQSKKTCLAAFALTEPEAGSDPARMTTTFVKDGDGYILNGRKSMITNGASAQILTLFATSNPTLKHKGITAFFIETDYPGVTIGKNEEKMGMNGSDLTEISFDNVRLTRDNLLGEENDGWGVAMSTLNLSRPAVGAQAVGIAQGALDFSAEYAWGRTQFGQRLAEHEGIQAMIGEMATGIEAARQLVLHAALLLDELPGFDRDTMGAMMADRASAMAKVYSADMAMKVTTEAVQILGSYGYTKDYPVERMMRDAKATQIYEGANQIQRMVIARSIFRKFKLKG